MKSTKSKIHTYIYALLKFIEAFGIIKGLYFACKLQLGFTNKIKIPQIAYPIRLRPKTSDIPTF
jgi:hypothetical protein